MKYAAALALALGLLAGAAEARPVSSIFADLNASAPRSVFEDLADSAPRSIFDDLRDSAPRSPFDRLGDVAPHAVGLEASVQQDFAGE